MEELATPKVPKAAERAPSVPMGILVRGGPSASTNPVCDHPVRASSKLPFTRLGSASAPCAVCESISARIRRRSRTPVLGREAKILWSSDQTGRSRQPIQLVLLFLLIARKRDQQAGNQT